MAHILKLQTNSMNLTYTTQVKDIELKSYNNDLILWFFGDVHRDATCDVERWIRFLKQSEKDDAYYFCLGDTHDFASGSEQKKLEDAHLHETTIADFDARAIQKNLDFCKEIKHMRGRILGFVEGNHSWYIKDKGKTSTEDLAERMEAPYLGWLCHYTLVVHIQSKSFAIHIVLCHGKAGGKTYGISINQVADLKVIFPVADIYCMGHDHQRWADPISSLVPVNNVTGWKIKQKEQLLCRSGSFKKSYEPGHAGYEAQKLLKPANLGALKVFVNFRRERKKNDITYTELSALV